MEKKKFDALITEILKDKAEPVSMPSYRAEAMKKNLRTMMKEESHMKKLNTKKVVVAAAAMCLLVSLAAVAGGKIVGYTSSVNINDVVKSYDKVVSAAPDKLGFTPAALNQFKNGFTFEDGYLTDVDCMDQDSNKVGSYPELTLTYGRDGQSVTFTASRPLGAEGEITSDAAENYDGIALNYKKEQYKFVPENYQLTEEDQKQIDSGALQVSYGTDQVELQGVSSVTWQQDGTSYLLMYMSKGDEKVSQADLMQMAKELVDAGKQN